MVKVGIGGKVKATLDKYRISGKEPNSGAISITSSYGNLSLCMMYQISEEPQNAEFIHVTFDTRRNTWSNLGHPMRHLKKLGTPDETPEATCTATVWTNLITIFAPNPESKCGFQGKDVLKNSTPKVNGKKKRKRSGVRSYMIVSNTMVFKAVVYVWQKTHIHISDKALDTHRYDIYRGNLSFVEHGFWF